MAGYDPRVLIEPGQRREDIQTQGTALDQLVRWLAAAMPQSYPGDLYDLVMPDTEGMAGDPQLQQLTNVLGLRAPPTSEEIGIALGGDPKHPARFVGEVLSPGPGEAKMAADVGMAGLAGAIARRRPERGMVEPPRNRDIDYVTRREAKRTEADELYGLEGGPGEFYEPTAREAAYERATRAEAAERGAEARKDANYQLALQSKQPGESTYQAYRRISPDDVGPLEEMVQRKVTGQGVAQEIPSDATSINKGKRPAVFNKTKWEPGTVNVDIGGGRFDNHTEWLAEEHGVTNHVIDPYNRSPDHNLQAAFEVDRRGGADTATISNVLNVVKEPEARAEILEQARTALKPGGEVRITVHAGDGKGTGRVTKVKDGEPASWQENRKLEDYLEEVREVFPGAYRKGDVIYASKQEPMFDLDKLGREQPELAREIDYYEPPRGTPAHMAALEENPEAFEQAMEWTRGGLGGVGEGWYDTAQLRSKFIDRFGEEEGGRRMKLFMDMVASTSTGADVPTNLKIASHYYGQGLEGPGAIRMPEKGSGYGHLMQQSHLQGAEKVMSGEGLSPIANPKRYTFSENLQGNWAESTVDKHNVRAWGIASRDPNFLKTQVGKDISPEPPAWWDPQKYGEYPVVEIKGKRMVDPKFRPQDFLKANPDVPWDQLSPMWFKEAPSKTEYRAYNRLNKRIADELGLSPAQAQAAMWIGAGERTGLGSPPKTFMELFHERIKATAEKQGISQDEALEQFMDGKIRLSQIMPDFQPDMGVPNLINSMAQREMYA